MSKPDTNQASEERIRGKLLSAYLDGRFSIEEIGKLTDKQAESVDRVIDRAIKLIRTEKLKLLAEVRERVVGEDELSYMIAPPLLDVEPSSARSGEDITYLLDVNTQNEARRREWEIAKIRYALRSEQRIELTKLEAEL